MFVLDLSSNAPEYCGKATEWVGFVKWDHEGRD